MRKLLLIGVLASPVILVVLTLCFQEVNKVEDLIGHYAGNMRCAAFWGNERDYADARFQHTRILGNVGRPNWQVASMQIQMSSYEAQAIRESNGCGHKG